MKQVFGIAKAIQLCMQLLNLLRTRDVTGSIAKCDELHKLISTYKNSC